LYSKYKAMAEALPNVHFAGRLGTYKYYNMDQVVAQALTLADKLGEQRSPTYSSNGHAGLAKRIVGIEEKATQGQGSSEAA
jgi:UDP-galactopyranose mutase